MKTQGMIRNLHFFFNLLMPMMNQYSRLDNGKGLHFIVIKAESKTPSGLVARPALTSYYKSAQFIQEMSKSASYTSPIEAILCPDFSQSMYCQLLCGLILKDEVVRMGAIFASSFLRAIQFLEENWISLCHDIHEGQLNPRITYQPVGAAVMKLLSVPNPVLAKRIRIECSKDSWQSIIGRIWKRACYIDLIITGTMSQYIPMLDFCSGGLPLFSSHYASSESFFGINLKPLAKPSEVSYTFLPNMGYFKFILVERSNDGDDDHVIIYQDLSYIGGIFSSMIIKIKVDFCSGGLPLFSSHYASSECFFGINLKPLAKPSEVSYTFLPNMGYFKFILVERSNDGNDDHVIIY